MSSQRPFFFSTFFSAIRQQQPSHQQPNKASSSSSASPSSSSATTNTTAPTAATTSTSAAATAATSPIPPPSTPARATPPPAQAPQHHAQSRSPGSVLSPPRPAIPIPGASRRRRGSDSSSEGFRDVLGADKWYVGGRTANGEERYFKLGVVKRVRSNDGFSIDKLSL